MDQVFLRYLIETKKIDPKIVANIDATFGQGADYEAENKVNDIIELLEECDLNPNVYLIEYPGLIELARIEDREELRRIIEYIKEYYKKNKKEKNQYLLIHLILAARQMLENQKQQETEQIITLLKQEGLMRIFEPKTNKSKAKVEQILYAEYRLIYKNISILKKEKTYKELVYANPLILINPNEKEVKELLEKYIQKNKKDNEQDKQEQRETTDNSKDNSENSKEDIDKEEEEKEKKKDKLTRERAKAYEYDSDVSMEENEERKISGHTISTQERRLLELGDEESVLPVLEAFNKYGISYNILNDNPDILKRTKIHNIPAIIQLLYVNNISFSVLYDCPEILQKGKAEDMNQIINELKTRGINLNIILTCPEILIKSDAERIREIYIKMEENGIDTYLIYSVPVILISGDIDKYINSMNVIDIGLAENIKEVIEILPNNHIVFKEITQSVNVESEDIKFKINPTRENRYNSKEKILVINNVSKAKKVLSALNDEGIDTEVVSKQPDILSRSERSILEISKKIKSEKLGLGILVKEPQILVKSSADNINNVIFCLKKYRPEAVQKIVKACPRLMYVANAKDVETVFKLLQKNGIELEVVEQVPQILLREDADEISKIIDNLNNKGYKKAEILKVPEILVRGKEKYIDRNFKTFQRNGINIPLHIVHCVSARNNEKNIDTLIENNLDRYIEKTPEILELKNSRLMQMLQIARQNNISVFRNTKNKQTGEKNTVLNIEYFKCTDEQLAQKYDLDPVYVRELGERAEREECKLRRVKNIKLYEAVYPILEKQASKELSEYEMDKVSYINGGNRVSKQKVIREAYLDLETKTEKEGKSVLNKIDTKKMLTRKLSTLSKNTGINSKENIECVRGERH